MVFPLPSFLVSFKDVRQVHPAAIGVGKLTQINHTSNNNCTLPIRFRSQKTAPQGAMLLETGF